MRSEETVSLKAERTAIRFRNDDGFLIGQFQPECRADEVGVRVNQSGRLAGLGKMFRPEVGMSYILQGNYSTHPKFGQQFNFTRYEVVKPKDTNGIFRYLVRVAKYVGPTVANRLIDCYGSETLAVLEADPEQVAHDISGLTYEKAKEIQTALLEDIKFQAVIIELESILDLPGIRKDLSIELVEKYGSDAAEKIKNNPYLLTQFNRVGFQTADKIAIRKLQIEPESIFRVSAAADYMLKEMMMSAGHVWIDKGNFFRSMKELLSIPIDVIRSSTQTLIDQNEIIEKNELFTLPFVDQDETYIAEKIYKLVA